MNESERQMFANRWIWHVPLETVDAMELQRLSPAYFEMLATRRTTSTGRPSTSRRATRQFEVPAYHFTGWYDTLLNGTLRNFAGLRKNARTERARSGQRLVVGPWTHSRPTPGSTKIGDVDFGPEPGSISKR